MTNYFKDFYFWEERGGGYTQSSSDASSGIFFNVNTKRNLIIWEWIWRTRAVLSI